jgi:hypothetical protein
MAISPIVIGIVMNARLSDFRGPVQDLATYTAGAGLALFLMQQSAAARASSR